MIINAIAAYEAGKLKPAEVIELFQGLLDCGVLFRLIGSYGAVGAHLLEQGFITRSPNHGARKRAKKRGAKVKAI